MKFTKSEIFRILLLLFGLSLVLWCFWSVREKMDERPSENWGVFFLGGCFAALISCFWWAYDLSKKAKTGDKLVGSRFQRTISGSKFAPETVEAWAKKRKFIRHLSSSAGHTVYLKKDYPVYPVFISIRDSEGVQILEAWVSTGKKDLPIQSGFKFLASLRLGLKDVNCLLESVGEEKVR